RDPGGRVRPLLRGDPGGLRPGHDAGRDPARRISHPVEEAPRRLRSDRQAGGLQPPARGPGEERVPDGVDLRRAPEEGLPRASRPAGRAPGHAPPGPGPPPEGGPPEDDGGAPVARHSRVSLVPFGLEEMGPRHYREMAKILWENRKEIPFAWRILKSGVCDGCALGTSGLSDWTID